MAEETNGKPSQVMITRKNKIINSALYDEVLDNALDGAVKNLPKYSSLLYYYTIHVMGEEYEKVIRNDPEIDIDKYVFSFSGEEFRRLNGISDNNHSYKYELKKSAEITGKIFMQFFMDNGESVGIIPHYSFFLYDGPKDKFFFRVQHDIFNWYVKDEEENSHSVDMAPCFSFNNVKGAMELYMFVSGISLLPEFKNNPKQFVELPLLYRVMRIKGYKDNFPGFKHNKLDPGIDVINKNTDLTFTYQEEKDISGNVVGIWICDVKKKSGLVDVITDSEASVEEEDIAVGKISDKVGFTNEESFKLFRLTGYSFHIFKKVAEMFEYVKSNDLIPLDNKEDVYDFFERQIKKLKENYEQGKM